MQQIFGASFTMLQFSQVYCSLNNYFSPLKYFPLSLSTFSLSCQFEQIAQAGHAYTKLLFTTHSGTLCVWSVTIIGNWRQIMCTYVDKIVFNFRAILGFKTELEGWHPHDLFINILAKYGSRKYGRSIQLIIQIYVRISACF